MDGVRGMVLLGLFAALLSYTSVSCKPLRSFPKPTRTSGSSQVFPNYSPMPVPAFSPFPYAYQPYIPKYDNFKQFPWSGTMPRSQPRVQENGETQFLGIGRGLKSVAGLAREYWPVISDCIDTFVNRNDNPDTQSDREALVNELESMWKREVRYDAQGRADISMQASEYWPLIKECVNQFVSTGGPDDTGVMQETGDPTADEQSLTAILGSLLVNYVLDRINSRGDDDDQTRMQAVQSWAREPTAEEQGLGTTLLGIALDRFSRRRDSNDQTSAGEQTAEEQTRVGGFLINHALQHLGKKTNNNDQSQMNAAVQAPGVFNGQNWAIARECLNDVFGGDSKQDGRNQMARRQQAIINEFRSVWTGQADLSKASAQLRISWPIVRDCVDRFSNRNNNNPPDDTRAENQNEIGDFLFEAVADKLIEKYQNSRGDNSAAQTHKTASAQFFNSGFWAIARECLNDVFGDDSTARGQEAVINEFRSVWTGKTDLSMASAQLRLNWPVIRNCVSRFVNRDDAVCDNALYVMAFTGDHRQASTIHPPFIELTVEDEVGLVQLPDLDRQAFQPNKGDIWKFDIADFGFEDQCISQLDVDGIAVVKSGTDGWLIDSIVTFVRDQDGQFQLLSSDIDANTWVDGNFSEESQRFDLTLV